MNDGQDRQALLRENAALRQRVEELERQALAGADAATFLQSVLGAAPAFIARADPELRLRYINRYQPGLTPENALGRPLIEFCAPEHRQTVTAVLVHTRDTGELGFYETDALGAHGEVANYASYVAAVPENDGRNGLCVFSFEVTAHKARDQALHESRELLRVALEATGLGLWSWDLERNQMVWDEAMQRLHGRAPPADFTSFVNEIVHPHDRTELRLSGGKLLERGRAEISPYRILRPDGSVRWVLTSGRVLSGEDGKPRKVVGGTLDVTEHRLLEEQARHAQKMEAIGSLSAGIAHNFNNMLMAIAPTLEIAMRVVPDDKQPMLQEAAHAAQRASELVRQLMTFAGPRWPASLESHDIGTIVDAAVAICRRTFDRRIVLETVYDGTAPAVVCHAGQIEQVLVNLLLNARDAILEAASPRCRITVRVYSELRPAAAGGANVPCVCIEVRDDGAGMTDEVKARAFEPFFTTKGLGRGTGLGLATSYAIVREHKGAITCESTLGAGSSFTVVLPLADHAQPIEHLPGDPPEGASVLLVDDDGAVRTAVRFLLAEARLRVRTAASGAQAIALLADEPSVDVVLLDRSMPDAPGERFVPRIRELAPSARILFFSGQTVEPELARIADGVVHKPVEGGALLAAIGRALSVPAVRSG